MHPFLSKWCFLRFKNKKKCVCLSLTQTTMIHIKPMDIKSEDDTQGSSKMIFQNMKIQLLQPEFESRRETPAALKIPLSNLALTHTF